MYRRVEGVPEFGKGAGTLLAAEEKDKSIISKDGMDGGGILVYEA